MGKIILDTAKPLRCGSCKKLIWPSESRLILGYRSVLIVLHFDCWELEQVLRTDDLKI